MSWEVFEHHGRSGKTAFLCVSVATKAHKAHPVVLQAAAGQANQELKAMLSKRDVENARLRDQREQQAAELNERKHKDSVKLASLQEWKALAESRSASTFCYWEMATTHMLSNRNVFWYWSRKSVGTRLSSRPMLALKT